MQCPIESGRCAISLSSMFSLHHTISVDEISLHEQFSVDCQETKWTVVRSLLGTIVHRNQTRLRFPHHLVVVDVQSEIVHQHYAPRKPSKSAE